MFDVIVVGGGPAGLQAALTLGRMHRPTLLLDSGTYRNSPVRHMHNFLTHDGTPPADFRSRARAELAAYDVEVRERTAERIVAAPDGGFVVTTSAGAEHRGHLVVLATGVRDELPPVPGLAEVWGELAFACPFCHGHELAGQPIGVLGGSHPHLVGLLAPVGSSVTVFADGADLTHEQAKALTCPGAELRTERVTAVRHTADHRLQVELGDDAVEVAGLFVATGSLAQAAPFAGQLGLELLPSGCIAVDDFGRTSRRGVLAAGDLAHRPSQPMPVSAVLAAAAAGQVAAATCVAELLAR